MLIMRILSLNLEPQINAATCAQTLMEVMDQEVSNPNEDNILIKYPQKKVRKCPSQFPRSQDEVFISFCPTNSPKPKYIQLTMIHMKQKRRSSHLRTWNQTFVSLV